MLEITREAPAAASPALVVLETAEEALENVMGACDEARGAVGQTDVVAPKAFGVAIERVEDDVDPATRLARRAARGAARSE